MIWLISVYQMSAFYQRNAHKKKNKTIKLIVISVATHKKFTVSTGISMLCLIIQ